MKASTVEMIQRTLEAAGVLFIDADDGGPSARLRGCGEAAPKVPTLTSNEYNDFILDPQIAKIVENKVPHLREELADMKYDVDIWSDELCWLAIHMRPSDAAFKI